MKKPDMIEKLERALEGVRGVAADLEAVGVELNRQESAESLSGVENYLREVIAALQAV